MFITYDPEADVLAVNFRFIEAGGLAGGKMLDDGCRVVSFDHQSQPASVEFLGASQGISLEGLPHADEIRAALQSLRGVLGVPSAA